MADIERINYDHDLIEYEDTYNKHLVFAIITIIIGVIIFISSSVFTGLTSGAAKGFFANWIAIPLIIALLAGGYIARAMLARKPAFEKHGLFAIKDAVDKILT